MTTENIFKCPISGQKLRFLSKQELISLNRQIDQSAIVTIDGTPVKLSVNDGLISSDERFIYPIIDDIYYLLPELVLLHKYSIINEINRLDNDKEQVKAFYDQLGWNKDKEGAYVDTKIFSVLSEEWNRKRNLRVLNHIKKTGTFMLDVASGPVRNPEFKTYSSNYKYRICVDLSLKALKEAKINLKEKGIYILGDITNLPFLDNIFDAVVSLNTIYHVPKGEQLKAFTEVYRVLKRGCNAVVVYSWGSHSILMKILYFPKLILIISDKIIRCIKNIIKKPGEKKEEVHNLPLYFHAYSYRWFMNNVFPKVNCEILSWCSIDWQFFGIFIHDSLFGKEILTIIFNLEEKYPHFFGKVGASPLIVMKK